MSSSVLRNRFHGVASLALSCAIGGLAVSAGSCSAGKRVSQPIAFSHRLHVSRKLSCTFCHSGARKYRFASIPSVTQCMSCHSVVKSDSPEIRKVRFYYDQRREIPWQRIYRLPGTADVFFNHHRHAAAGIQCSECHGDVGSRDSFDRQVDLVMGFCVTCHREHRGQFHPAALADDCATCHR